MSARGNPFVAEGIREYSSWEAILHTYLLLPGSLGLALLVVWPRGTFETVLRASSFPDPFTVIAAGFLIVLVYLSARHGAEDYSPDSLRQLREYVTLTPVPLSSVVAGKAAFAAGHTLFLMALGAPFLLASMAVSGVTLGRTLPAIAVIGASGFAARMFGLLVLAVAGNHGLRRDAILLPCIILYLAATLFLLPSVNPISAVLGISARGALPGTLSPSAVCSLFALGMAVLLAGAVHAVLDATRKRALRAKEAAAQAPPRAAPFDAPREGRDGDG
jgi:hypothetical protein